MEWRVCSLRNKLVNGNRHTPEYVLRLLEYYIQHEMIKKENIEDESV